MKSGSLPLYYINPTCLKTHHSLLPQRQASEQGFG